LAEVVLGGRATSSKQRMTTMALGMPASSGTGCRVGWNQVRTCAGAPRLARRGAQLRRTLVTVGLAAPTSQSSVCVSCDNIAGAGKATVVRVTCSDAPRLLSRLTDTLSNMGFNIITADVKTDGDGQVSDEFAVVDSKTSLPATTAQLEELRVRLTETAETPPSGLLRFVDQKEAKVWRKLVCEKMSTQPPANDVAVQVSIDCSPGEACIVSVVARDRVGLLRDITRLFQEHNLDIVEATISTTEPGVVQDAFVVRDADGYRVPETRQGELVRSLEAIAQPM